jgi:meso-butanediol dehydrogenase / (S,S)-butanediol dehydrogenase / diacetyl reductase
MSGLKGKVALITGAGNGIGAATARAFGAEGAAVAVVDLDQSAAEAVAKQIVSDGGSAIGLAGDVRDAAAAERLVADTVSGLGGLDILFNNAGIIRYGEVPDFSEQDWDAVIGTNLKAPFLMAKYAIPAMRMRGGGAVVNTASVQAFATQSTVAAYSASKGGIVALTMTMALDHAKDHIRVNCIAPGSVRTPMLESAARTFYPDDPEEGLREFGRAHPIGFLTEPEDVANLVLFLASDKARTITGACYQVDGGLLAKLGV